MKPDVIQRLEALNRTFYDRIAAAFSATRRAPWPGWTRVLSTVGRVDSVLDIGCGNGRLYNALPREVRYVGVDQCAALLAEATGGERILGDLWIAPWDQGEFDLVVAFGVLHHIPGRARRKTFVQRMLRASRGFVAVTAWRFDTSRAAPWSTVGVAEAELEPGDYLMPFGDQREVYRYCHAIEAEEIAEWFEDAEVVDAFDADGRDGRSNRYVVAR